MAPATLIPPGNQPKPRKRGPKPDFDTAARVAEIVARIAPEGDWRSKLDDISDALDEAEIPIPKRWRAWVAYPKRDLAVKAIEYRLEAAKQRSKPIAETFS